MVYGQLRSVVSTLFKRKKHERKRHCFCCGEEMIGGRYPRIPYRVPREAAVRDRQATTVVYSISPLCCGCMGSLETEQVVIYAFKCIDAFRRDNKCPNDVYCAMLDSMIFSISYLRGEMDGPPFASPLWNEPEKLNPCKN